ncbi:hypothetical protein BDV06DRAFT_229312 [Aspergillus oleicola]
MVAHYHDIAIGISRRFLRPSSVFPNNMQQEQAAKQELVAAREDPNNWVGTIVDKQAGHRFIAMTPLVLGKRANPWEEQVVDYQEQQRA